MAERSPSASLNRPSCMAFLRPGIIRTNAADCRSNGRRHGAKRDANSGIGHVTSAAATPNAEVMAHDEMLPSNPFTKRHFGLAGIAAVVACAACCALPFLAAAGIGGGVLSAAAG